MSPNLMSPSRNQLYLQKCKFFTSCLLQKNFCYTFFPLSEIKLLLVFSSLKNLSFMTKFLLFDNSRNYCFIILWTQFSFNELSSLSAFEFLAPITSPEVFLSSLFIIAGTSLFVTRNITPARLNTQS